MKTKTKLLAAASAVSLIIAADVSSASQEIRQISFTADASNATQSEVQNPENRNQQNAPVYGVNEQDNSFNLNRDEFGPDETATIDEDETKTVDTVLNDDEQSIEISEASSAAELIGQPVYNPDNARVGTVEDIILSRSGSIETVVIADGGFLSIRDKKASFDYNELNIQKVNGQLQMDISEEKIESASSFSYDPLDASDTVDVMPAGGVSVAKLLDSDVVDPENEVIASVDDIAFGAGGEAEQLIVRYGQVLGLGGNTAAIEFDTVRLVEDSDGARFELSANEAEKFRQMNEE